jgi:hypothetical protein
MEGLMSNQNNQKEMQSWSQERVFDLDASMQEIEALSDEELELISGGGLSSMFTKVKTLYQDRFQLHPENIIPAIKNKIQTARDTSSRDRGININGRRS